MKKIAVVLSGCGFQDGAEVTEAVSTLICLNQENTLVKVYAPNEEVEAVNHLTGEAEGRVNILEQSARIARGKVEELGNLNVNDFDGIVFPGGYGAALHLCTFAKKGADCAVDASVESIVREFHSQSKPIAAFCIAPALIAKVLGSEGVALTIGNDASTAEQIEKTGAQHVDCEVNDFVTDRANKVISSPAYMYDEALPDQVFSGIKKAIREFVEMA